MIKPNFYYLEFINLSEGTGTWVLLVHAIYPVLEQLYIQVSQFFNTEVTYIVGIE